MVDISPDLHSQQLALTRYLRDPDRHAPPAGMDAARASIYLDLVFNNLSGVLGGTFPVLIAVLGEAGWRDLIRRFLREHRAKTPYFGEIAQEFVAFVACLEVSSDQAQPGYPFLPELAHYEWVEMALQQFEAPPFQGAISSTCLIARSGYHRSPGRWPTPGPYTASGPGTCRT